MNKYDREYYKYSLEQEKALLKDLEKAYTEALAKIKQKIKELKADELTQSKIYQIEFQERLKKTLSDALTDLQTGQYNSIADYLQEVYSDAWVGSLFSAQGQGVPFIFTYEAAAVAKVVQLTADGILLSTRIGDNVEDLQKAVISELSRGLASDTGYREIARNVSNACGASYNRAKRIVQTEGHRVQQTAHFEAMKEAQARGVNMTKIWDSTLDGKTRPDHRRLDGQEKELDEHFTVSGHKALRPGAFGVAKEDINCRCVLIHKSEFDTEDFTKINNFNNKILEFKSQDDYRKFKEKFWSESNIAYMRYVDKLTEKYDNMQNALKNMTEREYKRYTELFNGSALK